MGWKRCECEVEEGGWREGEQNFLFKRGYMTFVKASLFVTERLILGKCHLVNTTMAYLNGKPASSST